jgi:signal peptidase I
MKPAISRGDSVVMEGVTYLFRSPQSGEIVVYRTDGLEGAQPGQLYNQRVAGKPGDTLRISDGKLYVNDKHLPLANSTGEITYANVPNSRFLTSSTQSVTVPDAHYFLLGDNSSHSFDSRFPGYVPVKNIRGRIIMRQ